MFTRQITSQLVQCQHKLAAQEFTGRAKNFPPRHRPLPGGGGARDGQNLISWRWSLPLPTNPVWRGLMHTISSYHGNRPTNTHMLPACLLQTRTQTGLIIIHCTAKLNAQCNKQNTIGEQWSLQANKVESKILVIAF